MLARSPEPEADDKVLTSRSLSNWNLEMLVFEERRKRRTRIKTSRSKDENQQQTQPTHDTGSGNRTRSTSVGGERSHHCAIPAPLERDKRLSRKWRPLLCICEVFFSTCEEDLDDHVVKIWTSSRFILNQLNYSLSISIFHSLIFLKYINSRGGLLL